MNERDYRKELWIAIAAAVASANNAIHKQTMISWADYAVAEFDKRFPQEEEVKT